MKISQNNKNILYLTHPELVRLNEKAKEKCFNRSIDPEFINKLEKDLKFPILFSMVHNESEMRCKVTFGPTPTSSTTNMEEGFLDIAFEDFNKLPKYFNSRV